MKVLTYAEAMVIDSGICQLATEGLRSISPKSFRVTFFGNEVTGGILSQSSVWKTSRRLRVHTFLDSENIEFTLRSGFHGKDSAVVNTSLSDARNGRMSIADLSSQETIHFWFVASNHISAFRYRR